MYLFDIISKNDEIKKEITPCSGRKLEGVCTQPLSDQLLSIPTSAHRRSLFLCPMPEPVHISELIPKALESLLEQSQEKEEVDG